MKLYAVQWLNPENMEWEVCQTFEEVIDKGDDFDETRVACVYFSKADAKSAHACWQADSRSTCRVARVKIKVVL